MIKYVIAITYCKSLCYLLLKIFVQLQQSFVLLLILNHSYYEIGQCLESLGKLEEALKYYNLGIKNGLDHYRYIHFDRYGLLVKLGREPN